MELELVNKLVETEKAESSVVLATVIKSHGSSPRAEGAQMLVWPDSSIVGTIGGGPAEAEVIAKSVELLKARQKEPEKLHFRMDNDTSAETGGICGGNVDIFLEPYNFNNGGVQ
ncbi:MAG: XdhC family protein [Bacillota bacterium]